MIHEKYYYLAQKQEELLSRRNNVDQSFYNGIYERYKNPVLTRNHVPIHWRFDLNRETNPNFQERLGVNAVFNPGAIFLKTNIILLFVWKE